MKTSNKLYFHTGDKQFLKVSGAFFEKNVYSVINLKPLIVDDNTINDSFISLDLENKITIFMLELCIKVLDQHPNKIDTHKNLRVKNLKAKNLKTLTASGTKLFNDTVIYDKIKEGSTVVSICLKMTWHNTESNCAELLEIQIYNLGCLKITINEPRNSPFRLEIVNFISQSITTLLSQKLHIPKNLALPYYFGGVMSRDAVLKSMVCEAIKEKLVKEESLLGHVKTVTSIINTYKKES